jgi:hypothetical protein
MENLSGMNSGGGRWYVSILTVLAAVAIVWGISEQSSSNAKQSTLTATER